MDPYFALDVSQINLGGPNSERVIRTGTGAPSGGQDGDLYIQMDGAAGAVLWRKENGTWEATVSKSSANIWTAAQTFAGVRVGSSHLLPVTPYTPTIGALDNKFLSLHAAELWVETLVAQNTMATIGGRVLVGPTNILARDLAPGDSVVYLKYPVSRLHIPSVQLGSKLLLEADGKFEVMYVASTAHPTPEPSDGSYAYLVGRDFDGSGAHQWYAGDAAFDTGQIGDGFIDLYSLRGVAATSQIGPSIVGNVRTGHGAVEWAPRWAVGNLNGIYGYNTDTYGAAFGDPAGAWVKVDPTNGVRIGHNATTKIALSATGSASFSEGNVTIDNTGIALPQQVVGGTPGASADTFNFKRSGATRGYVYAYHNTGTGLNETGIVATAFGSGTGHTGQVRLMAIDNSGAVARADLTTSGLRVEGGVRCVSGGIGYAAGAGGTVTQLTSKATGVTLHRLTGTITMHNASLAAQSFVAFTLTNATIEPDDFVLVQPIAGGTIAAYNCTAAAGAGFATIYVANLAPVPLAEPIVLKYVVIKAATS